jgi:hypothetical protein
MCHRRLNFAGQLKYSNRMTSLSPDFSSPDHAGVFSCAATWCHTHCDPEPRCPELPVVGDLDDPSTPALDGPELSNVMTIVSYYLTFGSCIFFL